MSQSLTQRTNDFECLNILFTENDKKLCTLEEYSNIIDYLFLMYL